MGDCACIDSNYSDDDGPEWSGETVITARKPHKCYECRETIPPGTNYQREVCKWDGRVQSFKLCLACVEIRGALFCGGWLYGAVWEEIEQSWGYGLNPMGCINELETVAAKEKLSARYRDFLELDYAH